MIAGLIFAACTAAAAAATTDGLVGNWQLDEGSGSQVADSSGAGNDGVLMAGPTWVTGHSGTALSFDGSSGDVQVPNSSSLEPPSAVTVSAWVKQDGSPGQYRYIVAKGASGCTAASYGLYSAPSGGLEFYVSRDRGTVYEQSPDAGDTVWDGQWHLVTGTFDGSTIRLFVDGTQVGSGASYPGALQYLLPDSNDLFVGGYPGCQGQDHEFRGVIDQVMVWNRALSAAEIGALIANTSGGTGTTSSPTPATPGSGSGASGGSNPARGGTSNPSGTGTSGGSPPAPPAPRTAAPAISDLRFLPSTLTLSRARPFAPDGEHPRPKVSYADSKASQSAFTLSLAKPGIRRAGRCVTPAARKTVPRRARCTRYATVARFSHQDTPGRTSLNFGVLLRRRLVPGRYRLAVTPRADGMVGRTVSVSFTVRR